MDNGWICMHRKILDWEWYGEDNMVRLFLYLLLSANYEDSQWRGRVVKKGQLITGLKKLSFATGLSEKSIRTCLNRLVKSGEIVKGATNKFTIITICNYNRYQRGGDDEGQTKGKRRADKIEKKSKKRQTNGKQKTIDIIGDLDKKSAEKKTKGKRRADKIEKKSKKRQHTNNKQNNNNNTTVSN